MANHFLLYGTLFLLATSSALMVMVAGDQCKQENGDCTGDCNNRCAAAISGRSRGLCGPGLGGVERCWCYYECQIKTCYEDFVIGDNCEDNECTLACSNRHPGGAAEGKCQITLPTNPCRCTFLCSAMARKFLP